MIILSTVTRILVDLLGKDPRAIERGLHWISYKTEMKIWAVGCGLGWTVLKKVWADYEQLLRLLFSTFCGQKNFSIKQLLCNFSMRLLKYL